MTPSNRNILVILRNPEKELNAIKHSLELTKIFNTSLSIAIIKENNSPDSITLVKNKISDLQGGKEFIVDIFLMEDKSKTLNVYIKKSKVFCLVFEMNKKGGFSGLKHRHTLNLIRHAKAPSIVVQKETPIKDHYKKVFIPVSYKKKCKELMVWASYFGRFHNAKLFLVTAAEKSQNMIRKINSLLLFSNSIFQKFSFYYKILKGKKGSLGIVKETFDLASENSAGMVMVLSDNEQNFIDIFLAPSELKSIFNKQKLPVMCVNPVKNYSIPYNK